MNLLRPFALTDGQQRSKLPLLTRKMCAGQERGLTQEQISELSGEQTLKSYLHAASLIVFIALDDAVGIAGIFKCNTHGIIKCNTHN